MTITEVSKEYELSPILSVIMSVMHPACHKKRRRNKGLSGEGLKWVSFAKCMRSAGLPVEVLIDYVNLWRQGDWYRRLARNCYLSKGKFFPERSRRCRPPLSVSITK